MPSKLPAKALDAAEDLITAPSSKQLSGQAVEREAGYILLGALCLSFPMEALLASIPTPSLSQVLRCPVKLIS